MTELIRGWHVGRNTPGYMPESDVYHYEEWKDAVDSLIDDIERGIPDTDDPAIATEYEDALTELTALREKFVEEALGYVLPTSDSQWDLGCSYWVTECLEAECQTNEEATR